jgi:hypothetical protein
VSDYQYKDNLPIKKNTMDVDESGSELSGEHNWIYDENGNLLREDEFEYEELTFYREMKYNNQNKIVSETLFHSADGKPSHEEMEWDGENVSHLIKTDIYGNRTESFYKFNNQGDVVSILFNSKEYNSETIVEYDDHKNSIHEKETDDKDVVLYEVFREYDSASGQIKRVETYINRMGQGTDVHYVLDHEYEFF